MNATLNINNLYLCDACESIVSRIIHFEDGDRCHECGYQEITRAIQCDGCGLPAAIMHADDAYIVCTECMDWENEDDDDDDDAWNEERIWHERQIYPA